MKTESSLNLPKKETEGEKKVKEDLRDYLLEMQEEIPTEVLESLTDFLEKTGKEEEEMKKRMQELSEGNRSLSMELEKLKTEYDSFIRTRYERDKETEYRNRDHERRLKNQHAEEIRRIRNGTWGAALGVLLIIIGPLMIPFFIQFGETVGTIPGWFMGLFRIMGQFFILIGKGYMGLVNLIPERCPLFVRHLIVSHVTGGAIGTFSWFIVYRQGIRRLKAFYEKRKERAELEGVW